MRSLFVSLILAATPFAHAEVVTIEVDNLPALLDRGLPIVDVRTADEWQQTGVIAGSTPLTFFDENGRADTAAWMKQFSRLAGPDEEVIVICRSGARSRKVAEFLDQQQHYRKVYTVEGGVIGWKALGRPTVAP